jgi:hypothetical protein
MARGLLTVRAESPRVSCEDCQLMLPLPLSYREIVEEIRPETALQNHLLQVLIAGGDEPNVNMDSSAAASPLVVLLLQNSQELWLQLQRELSNFIEITSQSLDSALIADSQ